MTGSDSTTMKTSSFRVLAGRHRILGLLGAGGMGSVFLARDLELDELVALKMLHKSLRGLGTESEQLDRFRSEVKLARRVTHKNVARTYDIGEHQGERFLTMEYVDGESLAELLDRNGSLDLPLFLTIAEQMIDGLAAAHEAGVVHRDLKPANVLLEREPSTRVVLTDFGIAAPSEAVDPDAHLDSEDVSGTPSYMAPEQFSGVADRRSDVYALGLVLFRALIGRRAFRSNHPLTRTGESPIALTARSDLPLGLSALLSKCLAIIPDERFASALEVRSAFAPILAAAAAERPALHPSPVTPHRVLDDVRREPRTVLVATTTDDPLSIDLRDAIVDALNDNAVARATHDLTAPHEVRAIVDLPPLTALSTRSNLEIRLFGARDDFEFWTETFVVANGEIANVARAAAEEILRALAISAVTSQRDLPAFGSAKAEHLYLSGRKSLRAFWPQYLRRAADSFSAALQLAPDHPLLLAAIATTRARQFFFSDCREEDARASAETALRAAPNLAEAHVAMATVHLQNNDAPHALDETLRALSLAPGLGEAHETLSRILLDAGFVVAAIRAAEIAQMRDPSLSGPRFEIARGHALLGRWDRCADALGPAASDATHGVVTLYHLRFASWRRETEAMGAILRRPRAGAADQIRAFYDLYDATLGGEYVEAAAVEAAHKMQAAKSGLRLQSFVTQIEAELRAFAGDSTGALSAFARSVARGLSDSLWCDRCPLFDDLRGDLRFESLRETVHARAKEVLVRFDAAGATVAAPSAPA